jgi:hypothetical protein
VKQPARESGRQANSQRASNEQPTKFILLSLTRSHLLSKMSGFGDAPSQQLQTERMHQFKSTVDSDQTTRRRRDQVVQIRRARKQDQLTKRRMVTDGKNRIMVGASDATTTMGETIPRTFGVSSHACMSIYLFILVDLF